MHALTKKDLLIKKKKKKKKKKEDLDMVKTRVMNFCPKVFTLDPAKLQMVHVRRF